MRLTGLLCAAALLASCAAPSARGEKEVLARGEAFVSAPASGARVSSPLRVEGVAPNDWYFEAIFSAELRRPDGSLIAEAPATAQSPWTTPGPVPFVAEFTFDVVEEQAGLIVLTEDQTGEKPQVRKVTLPVTLAPSP